MKNETRCTDTTEHIQLISSRHHDSAYNHRHLLLVFPFHGQCTELKTFAGEQMTSKQTTAGGVYSSDSSLYKKSSKNTDQIKENTIKIHWANMHNGLVHVDVMRNYIKSCQLTIT